MNQNLLLGSNVTVDELSKFISQSGVIVKPHVGRVRKKITLPNELLGSVSAADKAADNEFISEYITQGSLNLIPKSDERQLTSLETSVRSKVKQLAIACDGTFMPSDTYLKEYLPYFEEKKKKYLEKRDEIADKWSMLVDAFKMKLNAYLDRRHIPNKAAILAQVYANLPTKTEFVDSFYMDVSLTAFPVEENISMFSSEVADQVRKSITDNKVQMVSQMLGTVLSDAFDCINKFITYYNEKGVINKQQVMPLIDLKHRMIKNNILSHAWITNIIDHLAELETMYKCKTSDADDLVEMAEEILAKVYGFAKDVEVDNYLDLNNSCLPEESLASIYVALYPHSTNVTLSISA